MHMHIYRRNVRILAHMHVYWRVCTHMGVKLWAYKWAFLFENTHVSNLAWKYLQATFNKCKCTHNDALFTLMVPWTLCGSMADNNHMRTVKIFVNVHFSFFSSRRGGEWQHFPSWRRSGHQYHPLATPWKRRRRNRQTPTLGQSKEQFCEWAVSLLSRKDAVDWEKK